MRAERFAIAAVLTLAGCRYAGTVEVRVGPFPEGSAVFVMLADGPEGPVRLDGVPDELMEEPGVDDNLVGVPARRRDRANPAPTGHRDIHVDIEDAPRYIVLALDAERRWIAWTVDAAALATPPRQINLSLMTQRPADAALVQAAHPTIGLETPQFPRVRLSDDPVVDKGLRRYAAEQSARWRRTCTRFLGRCLEQAEAATGAGRLHDAASFLATFLNYRDARFSEVEWSAAGETAVRDMYAAFLALRTASDEGDTAACRKELARMRDCEAAMAEEE